MAPDSRHKNQTLKTMKTIQKYSKYYHHCLPTNATSGCFRTHLVAVLVPIILPVITIQTGRHLEVSDPFRIILASLCQYLGDFQDATKVHLEPLITVLESCAPSAHVSSLLLPPQSSKPGCIVNAAFRRRCDFAVGEPSAL